MAAAGGSRQEEDERYGRELQQLFRSLRAQAASNREHFHAGLTNNDQRFRAAFTRLHQHLDGGIEPGVTYLLSIVHLFDLDSATPANGYRSIITIIEKCCLHLLTLSRTITVNKDSFLFRGAHYSKELEAYVNTLGQLRACLYYLQRLVGYCQTGELFVNEDGLTSQEFQIAESLLEEVEMLSQETFYGRCLGFQYVESMVKPLTTLNWAMASFSEGYERSTSFMKIASTMYNSSKYIMNSELRAQQVVNITRGGDIKFCKEFWCLAENHLLQSVPRMVCPAVTLNKVISIQPEIFELAMEDGSDFARITPPCAHTGPSPVQVRLISACLRQGQDIWTNKKEKSADSAQQNSQLLNPAKCLLIHIHGGGFVAQSSASHEVYLRTWARDLNIPIFSIDYSLAPESPFPRQLEEVFYAYCWALRNVRLLGSTGERICVVGDSAGGNLAVAMVLRAIAVGIRKPDGILSAYGTFLIRYTPSPARIMALMDPLLPLGVIASVLAAYSGVGHHNGILIPSTSASMATIASPQQQNSRKGSTAGSSESGENVLFSLPEDDGNQKQFARHRSSASNVSCDSGYNDGLAKNTQSAAPQKDCKAQSHQNKESDTQCASPPDDMVHVNPAELEEEDNENSDIVHITAEDVAEEEESEEDQIVSINSDDANVQASPESLKRTQSPDSALSDEMDTPGASTATKPNRAAMRLDFQEMSIKRRRSPSESALKLMHRGGASCPSFTDANNSPQINKKNYNSPFGSPPTYAQLRHFAQSPVATFRHMPISKNPYMSPCLASAEMLRQFCPVSFVVCQLDPMLDDSVMMARRLQENGVKVTLDCVHGLPHGFLNFTLVSHDAKHASNLCVQRIREILQMDRLDIQDYIVINDDDVQEASPQ